MGLLTPFPTALTTAPSALLARLLTWLLKVLLALLDRSLTLIGSGMHASATAIRLGTGLVTIAAHGGAGLIASQPAGALIVSDLVLNPSVAADQAVITVAATVGHVRPIAVVPVVGLVAGVVVVSVAVVPISVVVIAVSIVIVVIAIPVDVVPGDVSVVVVVDVSSTASTTPIHSPCSEAPSSPKAAGNEAATTTADGGANRNPGAKGQPGCNGNRRCIRRHQQGRAIHNSRVVLRNVNHVTAGGLDDDGLRGLLHYLDLRRGL